MKNRSRILALLTPSIFFIVGLYTLKDFGMTIDEPESMVSAQAYLGAEEYFEVEYWGHAYKEGARWLNKHAEPHADILIPTMGWCGDVYLTNKSKPVPLETFFDTSKTRYLMAVTRICEELPFLEKLDTLYKPIYTIHRQKSTLLKIYKNDPSLRRF